MFRLAHISDIHLGPLPKPALTQLASKRILGYCNWHLSRRNTYSLEVLQSLIDGLQAQKPDHLAITGDLVNIALPQEFANAENFLSTLGSSRDVTVICGNHDAYVGSGMASAIGHWQPWMRGSEQPLVSAGDYPVMRRIGGIALIACNSAEATWPFMATGYFREPQAQKLSQLLVEAGRAGLCRVILIHHPPVHNTTRFHKRLVGVDLFQKAVRTHGAELILHGHTHLATRNQIEGKNGTVPVISVTAASSRIDGTRPAARYNLFEITRKNKSWAIKMQEHGLQRSGKFKLIAKHTLVML